MSEEKEDNIRWMNYEQYEKEKKWLEEREQDMVLRHQLRMKDLGDSISVWAWATWQILVKANISTINEGEIVKLVPDKMITIMKIDEWDGELAPNKKPIVGDLGVDNKRNMYRWGMDNKWKLIVEYDTHKSGT